MKRYLLFIIALFAYSFSFGQGEMDAFKYGRNDLTGTARAMGMAGAFGALGADITGVASNPAGIGLYRSSEVVATMNFASTNIKTDLLGSTMSENNFKFNFDNLAYMGYFPIENSALQCFNVGFSYNRLKNFDRNYSSSGQGLNTSLASYIAAMTNNYNRGNGIFAGDLGLNDDDHYNAGRFDTYPWLSILGYNSYIINPKGDDPTHYLPGNFDTEHTNNNLNVSERGAVESYDLNFGTNISDVFYLGASASYTSLTYEMTSNYYEAFERGGEYTLSNWLRTEGSGYNFTVGAIVRPIAELKLGVAYHSPIWYNMTDFFNANTKDNIYKSGEYIPNPLPERYSNNVFRSDVYHPATTYTPDSYTDYKYQSPYRWVFSAAATLGTKAIVSVDYEITDFSKMNLKERSGQSYTKQNEFISEDFKMASTIKAGLEISPTRDASIRVGYAWMQSPLVAEFRNGEREVATVGTIPNYTLEGDVNYFTIGAGYRLTRNFYVDAAFVYRTQTDDLYNFSKVYNYDDQTLAANTTPAKFNNKQYKGILTLRYKFGNY